jgi:hypothetical protein
MLLLWKIGVTELTGLIDHWQTLIAGAIALLGAWMTVRALQLQAREASERKCQAARALLPAALASVDDYVMVGVRWLKDLQERYRQAEKSGAKTFPLGSVFPRIDGGTVAMLRDCIEHAHISASRAITKLLQEIQVHDSRLSGLRDYFENPEQHLVKRAGLNRNIEDFMANAIEIGARTRQLFAYARGETDSAGQLIESQALSSAFIACGFDWTADKAIWDVLAKRHPGVN